eukprot:COSAG01_NODE_6459_length_3657_cov_2.202923_6_plen_282_part_00
MNAPAQRRTSTARNCNDVRPRELLGAIDVMEQVCANDQSSSASDEDWEPPYLPRFCRAADLSTHSVSGAERGPSGTPAAADAAPPAPPIPSPPQMYKQGKVVDCALTYKEGMVDRKAKPTAETEVWTFTKRIANPATAQPLLVQVGAHTPYLTAPGASFIEAPCPPFISASRWYGTTASQCEGQAIPHVLSGWRYPPGQRCAWGACGLGGGGRDAAAVAADRDPGRPHCCGRQAGGRCAGGRASQPGLRVPPPRHDHPDPNSGLTEICLRLRYAGTDMVLI